MHHSPPTANSYVYTLSKALVQIDCKAANRIWNAKADSIRMNVAIAIANSNSCGHECVNLSEKYDFETSHKTILRCSEQPMGGFLRYGRERRRQKIQCKFVGNFCVLIRHIHRKMSIVSSIVSIWWNPITEEINCLERFANVHTFLVVSPVLHSKTPNNFKSFCMAFCEQWSKPALNRLWCVCCCVHEQLNNNIKNWEAKFEFRAHEEKNAGYQYNQSLFFCHHRQTQSVTHSL